MRIVALLLLAAVIAVGYTAYAGTRVYADLGSGRDHLLAGQADFTAAIKTADLGTLRSAAVELAAAEGDFRRGSARLQSDLALQLGAHAPGTREQVAAVTHLAAIGEDLAQAGSAAELIAEGMVTLKQTYGGRTLMPADLAALAHDADALAQRYAAAATTIQQNLQAAHRERAQVTSTGLVSPLHAAYDQVDEALSAADVAFVQFQDPRRVLSQWFGITLPG